MKTKVEQSSGRQDDIVTAAQLIFAELGYKKVTIDDVAQKLSMTRTALYYYYKNKEELFCAVLERELTHYRNNFTQSLNKAGSTESKLESIYAHLGQLKKNCVNMYKLSLDDFHSHAEIFLPLREKVYHLYIENIIGILENDPLVSKRNDIPDIARIFFLAMKGVYIGIKKSDTKNLQSDMRKFIMTFYQGIISGYEK